MSNSQIQYQLKKNVKNIEFNKNGAMSNTEVLIKTFTNSISSEIEANSISHNPVKIKMLSAFLFRCAASLGATDAGYATIIFRNPQNYEGLLVYKSEKWYKVGTKLNLSANYF